MKSWVLVALTGLLAMSFAPDASAHDPEMQSRYLLEEKLKSPWVTRNGFKVDFPAALNAAMKSEKLIFAYFTISYMDVAACTAVEAGVLSTPEFKKFGESVVLFMHVDSGLGGEYANLLSEKGGTGVPTFLVMDDQGNVVAKVASGHDVPNFEAAVKSGREFAKLRGKADKTGDEKVYVVAHDMEFGNLKLQLAKERVAGLGELGDAQRKQIADAMLHLEIRTAMAGARRTQKSARAAGKLFSEMWAAGREPTTDEYVKPFFALVLQHAEAVKDADLFETALKKLEERFGEDADAQDFFDDQAKRLERLRSEIKSADDTPGDDNEE